MHFWTASASFRMVLGDRVSLRMWMRVRGMSAEGD